MELISVDQQQELMLWVSLPNPCSDTHGFRKKAEGEREEQSPQRALHYCLQPGALQSVILLSEFHPVHLPGYYLASQVLRVPYLPLTSSLQVPLSCVIMGKYLVFSFRITPSLAHPLGSEWGQHLPRLTPTISLLVLVWRCNFDALFL